MRDVVAREITASSSVGDVVVQSAETPTIEARSEVGSIEIRPLATTRSITATSNVGSITVLVPSGIEYDVQVSSDVGDVSVGIPTAPSAPRSIVATSDIGDVRIAPER